MTAGKWLKTACNLCYINCGIEVLVNDERLEKVRGDRSSPKSQGYLCNKATRIPYYAHHRDRLTTPLRRRAAGGFDRPASRMLSESFPAPTARDSTIDPTMVAIAPVAIWRAC